MFLKDKLFGFFTVCRFIFERNSLLKAVLLGRVLLIAEEVENLSWSCFSLCHAVHQGSSSPCNWLFFRHNLFKLAFFLHAAFCQISCWLLLQCPLAWLFHPVPNCVIHGVSHSWPSTLWKKSCDHMNFLSCKWWLWFISAIFLLQQHFFWISLISICYLFITLNIKLSSAPPALYYFLLCPTSFFFLPL